MSVEQETARWLNEVVIGLELCPFARRPMAANRVRLSVSDARNEEELLRDLANEMKLLDTTPASELETTLVILPNYLQDFFDYSQFIGWSASWLKREGWRGVYQLASFHPQYCFAGSDPDDAENLTNRSPYPILHIIREESLSRALEFIEDVDLIPENNQRTVEALTAEEKRRLFPYLFT